MRLLQCVIRQVTVVTILYTPHLVSTQQQNMDTLVSRHPITVPILVDFA